MHARQIVVCLCVFPLFGCGDAGWVSPPSDPRIEPTYQFWVSLQSIHKTHYPEIGRMLKEMNSAVDNCDWNGTVELLHKVRDKHRTMAAEFDGLSHDKVDVQLRAFRDSLVRSHQAMAEASEQLGTAVKDRDVKDFQMEQFAKLYEDHVVFWESSIEVVGALQQRYGKDFNVPQ